MTGRYYKVSPSVWLEPWDEDTRWVALYLLSSPHRSLEGLFRLPLEYARADMRWPIKRFTVAFEHLIGVGFIEYDHDTAVCLICKALKWQGPVNPNQAAAAVKLLEQLPPTRLLWRLYELAQLYCDRLAKVMAQRFPQLLGQPLPERLAELARARPPASIQTVGSSNASVGTRATLTDEQP